MYNNKRSKEAKERRFQKTKRKESAHTILLNYSYRDNQKVQGEIVFEPKSEKIVRAKITEEYGFIPQHIFQNREYGDVLNAKVEFLPVTTARYTDPEVQVVRWTFEK